MGDMFDLRSCRAPVKGRTASFSIEASGMGRSPGKKASIHDVMAAVLASPGLETI